VPQKFSGAKSRLEKGQSERMAYPRVLKDQHQKGRKDIGSTKTGWKRGEKGVSTDWVERTPDGLERATRGVPGKVTKAGNPKGKRRMLNDIATIL